MPDYIHISGWVASCIGVLIVMMLGVIAYFVKRLIDKIDELNLTMIRFDRDVSQDIALLKEKTRGNDELFSRLREAENEVTEINAGGCKAFNQVCRRNV